MHNLFCYASFKIVMFCFHQISCFALICWAADMSSTAFIEPLPVIDFVNQLLNRDVSSRPLSDADRVKVRSVYFYFIFFLGHGY